MSQLVILEKLTILILIRLAVKKEKRVRERFSHALSPAHFSLSNIHRKSKNPTLISPENQESNFNLAGKLPFQVSDKPISPPSKTKIPIRYVAGNTHSETTLIHYSPLIVLLIIYYWMQ